MEPTITLAGVLLAAICIYAVVRKLRYRRRDQLLGQMRSPPAYPIIGNAWLVIQSAEDFWKVFENFLVEYGTPFVFWAGSNIPVVIMSKLEDIREISKKCIHREVYGLVDETLGDGLLFQGCEKWRYIRRLLNGAFGPLMLSQYTCVFNEQARIMIDILKGYADTGKSFDAAPLLMNANVDMITENMTGVKLSVQKTLDNEFSHACREIFSITVRRAVNPIMHLSCVFRAYMWLTGQDRITKALNDLPDRALKAAKRNVESKYQHSNRRSSLSMPDKPVKSAIEILVAAQYSDHPLSNQQIQHAMVHLILGGSETTMLTVGFLLLMLGINQDIQEKVYNEIVQEVGTDSHIKLGDLGNLQYLDQCIKETLRRFTVAPATLRTTTKDMTLPSGKTIPSDCAVLLHLKSLHNNTEYYQNPSQWNPDNFSPEAVAARPMDSFAGFGLGPRCCIGYKYALISMKIQMCYILRNYRVHTPLKYEDIEVTADILLRSTKGYPITLTSRDEAARNANNM